MRISNRFKIDWQPTNCKPILPNKKPGIYPGFLFLLCSSGFLPLFTFSLSHFLTFGSVTVY